MWELPCMKLKRYLQNSPACDALWQALLEVSLSPFLCVCRVGRCETVQPLRNVQINKALQLLSTWLCRCLELKSRAGGTGGCGIFALPLALLWTPRFCWKKPLQERLSSNPVSLIFGLYPCRAPVILGVETTQPLVLRRPGQAQELTPEELA